MTYYLQIFDQQTDEVLKQIGPMGERRAERTRMEVLENFNMDKFYLKVVSEKYKVEETPELEDGFWRSREESL